MEFNTNVKARYAVDRRFFDTASRTVFLGGTESYNEAVSFVLGLELDGKTEYVVYDRATQQDVFHSGSHGYGGFASEDDIREGADDGARISTPARASGGDGRWRR